MFYLQKENEEWSFEKHKNFDFELNTVVRGFLKDKDN